MTIRISADLEPVPFKRTLANGRRHFNDPRYSAFKAALGLLARVAMKGREPFTGAVKLTVDVYRHTLPTSLRYGDWDNHGKAVSDALNGICYIDDRQVVEGHVFLHHGDPHITIELEEL